MGKSSPAAVRQSLKQSWRSHLSGSHQDKNPTSVTRFCAVFILSDGSNRSLRDWQRHSAISASRAKRVQIDSVLDEARTAKLSLPLLDRRPSTLVTLVYHIVLLTIAHRSSSELTLATFWSLKTPTSRRCVIYFTDIEAILVCRFSFPRRKMANLSIPSAPSRKGTQNPRIVLLVNESWLLAWQVCGWL